jgi:hypothetical protein
MASRRILFFILLFISQRLMAQNTTWGDYKLVGNQTGISQLTAVQTKEYFKGKYTLWSSGKSVKVVLHSSQSKHSEALAKLIYNMTQQGVQKFWLSLVFQGRANPPVFLDSDAEIVNYVSKTPGSIAIITKESYCPAQLIISIK